MNTVKRIAKNTLVLTVADIFSKMLSLILLAYIARFLGDVGFGKYSFALSFTALFAVLADMGLSTLTIREVARDKNKADRYLGNIALIKTLLSLLTFALIFITINFMHYPHDTTIAVYILGLYWILTSFAQFFRSIFRAFEQMEYEALTIIIERTIAVSLALFVLVRGYGLIELALVILFAGIVNAILSFFIVIRKFTKPKFEFDPEFWKFLFKEGLPFGLIAIFFMSHSRIDIVLLSTMRGDATVGWYNAAKVLVESLFFMSSFFVVSVFPVISRFFVSSKDSLAVAYEKSFKFLTILGFPVVVGTALLSDRFISFIYGSSFVNSAIALKILIWTLLPIFLNQLLGIVLRSIDRQRESMYVLGVAVFFNVVLNLLVIPIFSYIGAAFVKVVTEVFVFIFYFYLTSKFVVRLPLLALLFPPLLASGVMGIFVYFSSALPLPLIVVTGALIYFGTLYVIRGIADDDVKLFKEIFKSA